ncbi:MULTISPECIES: hypothetical protein [unclassified Prochlorococcus]|uniref:hypothetical protein n=1 Tax=unclassified Prochlorococcus TaxID=2627481 RepID=UPI000533B426|nr:MULTISPECIES: hypothetical protein [unclassified Prochlorococcus]KGG16458.1 hypothetical protein EV06_0295 [Prochlorococcus sp. MIT 0602]KGG17068.1 hypothetical protein EV07_0499 [Prochlorococcus sp. MIT 0603]
MASLGKQSIDLQELIELLNEDRALILEKIDQGYWPEMRQDLAALERELGQFLELASKRLEHTE